MAETTMAPQVGEEFVWMEAEPGMWDEALHTVMEVIGPDREEEGVWHVGYALPETPDWFARLSAASSGAPEMRERLRLPEYQTCRVQRGWDGRWHAHRPEGEHD